MPLDRKYVYQAMKSLETVVLLVLVYETMTFG